MFMVCSLVGRMMAFEASDIRSIRITPIFRGDIVYLVECKICNLVRAVQVCLSPYLFVYVYILGKIPKRPTGVGCKPIAYRCVGSTPTFAIFVILFI